MKEMLHDIVESIIGEGRQIDIVERTSEGEDDQSDLIVLELTVAREDMGKVIGKRGRIAKSIRTMVKACASRRHQKVTVEIV
ncbi:UPF0109 protein [Clostridia bacterium]|nr:UPF0109 protein [Clostridia bacterium]